MQKGTRRSSASLKHGQKMKVAIYLVMAKSAIGR